jgi:hypothetical protein
VRRGSDCYQGRPVWPRQGLGRSGQGEARLSAQEAAVGQMSRRSPFGYAVEVGDDMLAKGANGSANDEGRPLLDQYAWLRCVAS